MAVQIPENLQDLIDRPIVTTVITVMPDGQPQATPVWYIYEDGYFVFNTAEGRQKERNLNRDSKVTFLTIDPQNQFHWIEIRGHVAHVFRESEGQPEARASINSLSKKYTGNENYTGSGNTGEQRVKYLIEADKVNGQ